MTVVKPSRRTSRSNLIRRAVKAAVWGATVLVSPLPIRAESVVAPAATGEEPTFAQVVSLAKAHAPRVLLENANLATARAAMIGARLPIVQNPYVEVTAERGPAGSRSALSATGTVWLPFEIGGQRSRRIDVARAGITLQNQALREARALAVAEAIQAYGRAVVGSERLRVLAELEAVATEEAETYRARFAAGDATIQDARFAEVDEARYRVMSAQAAADVEAALTDLGVVTGKAFHTAPRAQLLPPAIAPVDASAAPAVARARAEATYYGRERARWRHEASGAMSLMLIGGADELGGARVGGGIAYTIPAFHAFQGERAHAEAERTRALLEEHVARLNIDARLEGMRRERAEVARAISVLMTQAEPAARAAVEAANEMRRLGKGEFLAVLTSRRDLGLLRLEYLDLVDRQWRLTSAEAALTGGTS